MDGDLQDRYLKCISSNVFYRLEFHCFVFEWSVTFTAIGANNVKILALNFPIFFLEFVFPP